MSIIVFLFALPGFLTSKRLGRFEKVSTGFVPDFNGNLSSTFG